MSIINRHNYEPYLLDHLEGNLGAEQTAALQHFLAQHPDLAAEWEGLQLITIPVDETLVFPNKNRLKKEVSEPIPLAPAVFSLRSIRPLFYAAAAVLLLIGAWQPLSQLLLQPIETTAPMATVENQPSVQNSNLASEPIAPEAVTPPIAETISTTPVSSTKNIASQSASNTQGATASFTTQRSTAGRLVKKEGNVVGSRAFMPPSATGSENLVANNAPSTPSVSQAMQPIGTARTETAPAHLDNLQADVVTAQAKPAPFDTAPRKAQPKITPKPKLADASTPNVFAQLEDAVLPESMRRSADDLSISVEIPMRSEYRQLLNGILRNR